MALVTNFEENTKNRQSVHRPTRCLYAIVGGPNGERFLQLDTVGSDGREIPDKVSQSIQFDRQAAGQLIQLLLRTFPDLEVGEGSTTTKKEESSDAEEEAEEGRTLFRLHRLKERKPGLVRRKKQSVLNATGRLSCEVCNFDFARFYGAMGDGFAECHHRTPLAELIAATKTRLIDLAIVCANCHRMLHRCPNPSVEALRSLVESRLKAV